MTARGATRSRAAAGAPLTSALFGLGLVQGPPPPYPRSVVATASAAANAAVANAAAARAAAAVAVARAALIAALAAASAAMTMIVNFMKPTSTMKMPGVTEAGFKFRHYLDQLAQTIYKYSVFLKKEAQKRADVSEVAKRAAASQASTKGPNLASYTVYPDQDSEYAARCYKMIRHFAVECKRTGIQVVMVSMDDKCSAKVGNLDDAVAATERNKSVVMHHDAQTIASRHDFTGLKVNPSVMLISTTEFIPADVSESFYRGQVFVSVKDAVFEPSFPLRHAGELKRVLKEVSVWDSLEVLKAHEVALAVWFSRAHRTQLCRWESISHFVPCERELDLAHDLG